LNHPPRLSDERALGLSLLAMTGAVVARGTPLLALLIAARILSEREFGVYAIAMVAISLAAAVISGGGSLWANRYGAPGHEVSAWRDAVRFRYLQIVAALAAAAGLSALLAGLAAPAEARAVIAAAAAAAIASGLGEAIFALLRSRGALVGFFLLRDLATPLAFLALLLIVRPERAAGAVALAPLGALVPIALAGGALARAGLIAPPAAVRRLCRGRRTAALLGHSARMIAANLAARLAVGVDVLLLALLVGAATVGEYRAAAQLALGFLVIQNAVFLGLPWQLRDQGDERERADRRRAIAGRQRLLVAASGPALLLLLLFPGPILGLFGPAFTDAAPLLRALCVIRFLDLLWGPQAQLLLSNGLVLREALAGMASSLTWLAGFALLAATAAPGVTAAAAGAQAIAACCGQLYRRRILGRQGLDAARPAGLVASALVLCYALALGMTMSTGA
jgi:O-antigen/teichoic acid export membrane protein